MLVEEERWKPGFSQNLENRQSTKYDQLPSLFVPLIYLLSTYPAGSPICKNGSTKLTHKTKEKEFALELYLFSYPKFCVSELILYNGSKQWSVKVAPYSVKCSIIRQVQLPFHVLNDRKHWYDILQIIWLMEMLGSWHHIKLHKGHPINRPSTHARSWQHVNNTLGDHSCKRLEKKI